MNDDPSREAMPPEGEPAADRPERDAGGERPGTADEEILDLESGGAPADDADARPLDLDEGRPPPPDSLKVKKPQLKETGMKLLVENVRAQVARGLVAILAVVILFSFLTLWLLSPPPSLADLEKLLTIIFGPLVALVSGAVGYYFGGKSDEEQQQAPEGENGGGGQ